MSFGTRVETSQQRIRVFLRGGILAEGDAHVKQGAYRQRVSDLFNMQEAPFLPLTDVSYQAPGSSPMRTQAFLVSIPDIVAVDLLDTPSSMYPEQLDAGMAAYAESQDAYFVQPPPPDPASAGDSAPVDTADGDDD